MLSPTDRAATTSSWRVWGGLAELNQQADDYVAVVGMAGAVRTALLQASGLSQQAFDEMMGPLEAAADGSAPAPRPASTPPGNAPADAFGFDHEAFRAEIGAEIDRAFNELLAGRAN